MYDRTLANVDTMLHTISLLVMDLNTINYSVFRGTMYGQINVVHILVRWRGRKDVLLDLYRKLDSPSDEERLDLLISSL